MRIPRTIPIDVLSDPKALYDFIMKYIEPDLVTENLSKLDKPYVGETAEERKNRYAQYSAAYMQFEKIVTELFADIESRTYRLATAMDFAAAAEDIQTGTTKLEDISKEINKQ